jgi:2,5-diamino-6-(ribosylamino)-4(3H)-pyrimidinone 5'-phosphate reductase
MLCITTQSLYIGKLDFLTVLNDLKQAGIDSIMVEGGQRIISSLLATSPPLVDLVIITIAPMLVGSDGTGVTEDDQVSVSLLWMAVGAY